MPKLRRLSGLEVVSILEQFGFEVVRTRGSHYQMKRVSEDRDRRLLYLYTAVNLFRSGLFVQFTGRQVSTFLKPTYDLIFTQISCGVMMERNTRHHA